MAVMSCLPMAWDVELTDECEAWWTSLTQAEQESVGHGFDLLAELGPALSRLHTDTLKGSRYPNLKELRVQHEGRPYRVLYAFDPRRVALLLLEAIRPVMADGMRKPYRRPRRSMPNTWRNCDEELEGSSWRDVGG